jgi:hypothetical protein
MLPARAAYNDTVLHIVMSWSTQRGVRYEPPDPRSSLPARDCDSMQANAAVVWRGGLPCLPDIHCVWASAGDPHVVVVCSHGCRSMFGSTYGSSRGHKLIAQDPWGHIVISMQCAAWLVFRSHLTPTQTCCCVPAPGACLHQDLPS